jgi:hypothetical protein
MMIVTDEQVKQQWYDHLTNEYDLQAIVLAHYLVEGDNRPDYDEAQEATSTTRLPRVHRRRGRRSSA